MKRIIAILATFFCAYGVTTYCMVTSLSERKKSPKRLLFESTCCKTVDEFDVANGKTFGEMLDDIVKKQVSYHQKNLEAPMMGSSFDKKILQDSVRMHYEHIYEKLKKGKCRAFVYRHATDAHFILFFNLDESFNAIRVHEYIQVHGNVDKYFFYFGHQVKAFPSVFFNTKKIIIALSKNFPWMIDVILQLKFSPCIYTGDQIDLDENIVFERSIY